MQLPTGPFVTTLAAVLAVFHILLLVTGLAPEAIIMAGFIPARFGMGVVETGPMVPAILTPLTSFFLHYELVSLVFNLILLLFIGRQLEAPIGKGRVALVLIAGAYGGALMVWLVQPRLDMPMVGANASVAALVAVFALIFSSFDVRPLGPIPARWVRTIWLGAAWIGLQLLAGLASGSFAIPTIWASIGGFLAGLILARPLLRWRFGGR